VSNFFDFCVLGMRGLYLNETRCHLYGDYETRTIRMDEEVLENTFLRVNFSNMEVFSESYGILPSLYVRKSYIDLYAVIRQKLLGGMFDLSTSAWHWKVNVPVILFMPVYRRSRFCE
jgi:hypothetical protein